jgi:hypothetical protein
MRPLGHVILSRPECCALSTSAETVFRHSRPSTGSGQATAGIQFAIPRFRVAASGLARNDGRVIFVIPAKAGIQVDWAFFSEQPFDYAQDRLRWAQGDIAAVPISCDLICALLLSFLSTARNRHPQHNRRFEEQAGYTNRHGESALPRKIPRLTTTRRRIAGG